MEILNRIDHFHSQLQALLPMKDEFQQNLDKKFRLEFSYNSNHLEGNTLTYGETKLLLIFDDTKGNHTMREYEEMKAHDVAFKWIEELANDKERPLTEQSIKTLNELILVRPFWKEAITDAGQDTQRLIKVGQYKEQSNSVRLPNGEFFEYASVIDTPIKMQELVDWYREQENLMHPIMLAAILHYKFVLIHPFDDGNGRVSRLLMNYVLLKFGFPPVIIKSAEKASYLRALHLADAGDLEAFIEYIGQQMDWSIDISIKAAKGENIDEPGDLDKKLLQLKQKLGLVDSRLGTIFDISSFTSVIQHKISLLVSLWEDKLSEFDLFFLSRISIGKTNAYSFSDNDLSKILQTINRKEVDLSLRSDFTLNFLALSCKFSGFKEIQSELTFNGGELRFDFHRNAYEISYTGSESKITKLYSDEISEEERRMIVETMGNVLLKNIEQAIAENKKDL